MGFHNRLAQTQAQPVAPGIFCAGLIHSIKRFENMRQLLLRNTDSKIRDPDDGIGFPAFIGYLDGLTVRPRIFDGIAEHIIEYRFDLVGIHRGSNLSRKINHFGARRLVIKCPQRLLQKCG